MTSSTVIAAMRFGMSLVSTLNEGDLQVKRYGLTSEDSSHQPSTGYSRPEMSCSIRETSGSWRNRSSTDLREKNCSCCEPRTNGSCCRSFLPFLSAERAILRSRYVEERLGSLSRNKFLNWKTPLMADTEFALPPIGRAASDVEAAFRGK